MSSTSIQSCTMPGADRSVAQHRGRDDVPADRLRHAIGRHLAIRQGPVGEVVEGPLAADRLVDAGRDEIGLRVRDSGA